MFDIFFAMMAAGLNGTGAPQDGESLLTLEQPSAQIAPATEQSQAAVADTVQIAPGSVVIGQGTVIQGTPITPAPLPAPTAVASGFNMTVVPAGLIAEPQTPSGKFTTAAEIKPILGATKGNWVAVREYDGGDLLYVSHLWGWRCGLKAMAISVNNEAMQNWPLPPCHEKYTTPNALLPDDGAPYLRFRLGSVQTITIQIVYDDLSMDVASFERGNVLIP